MNWYSQANKGEGFEYFILVFGLAIVALIAGGGKASIDSVITRKTYKVRNAFFASEKKAIA